MEKADLAHLTHYMEQWRQGDVGAYDHLVDLVYPDLKRLAGSALKGFPHQNTLSPTALVNEAYLKLVGHQPRHSWVHRGQFFGLISKTMMSILVDAARKRKSLKNGGEVPRITLDGNEGQLQNTLDIIVLNDCLERLDRLDPERCRIWRCRYLCGLSIAELEDLFQLGSTKLHKELRAANIWLRRRLQAGEES